MTARLLCRVDGPIGWIVFDNPLHRNAITFSMWEALHTAAKQMASDAAVNVVVVRGEGGKAFVSGADIAEFETLRSKPEQVARYRAVADGATLALQDVGKPVIAMIDGYCLGGGISIALACDLRLAGRRAVFGIPAAKLGVGYELPGVRKLVDLVGPAKAKEIFFTATRYEASDALAMGLVNAVVDDERLESFVVEKAMQIAANAPLTLASIKTIVGELMKDQDSRDDDLCEQVVTRCFESDDYREGRLAFLEKRVPRFNGT